MRLGALLVLLWCVCDGRAVNVGFVCKEDNDLWRTAGAAVGFTRYGTLEEGISSASDNSVLLILPLDYPYNSTYVSASQWKTMASKNLKVYIETPDCLPGLKCSPISPADYYHRIVVTKQFGDMAPLTILSTNVAYFIALWDTTDSDTPCCIEQSVLVFDKVAGVDKAVFGLSPPKLLNPVLFTYKYTGLPSTLWVSSIKISQMVTAQYRPVQHWHNILQTLLRKLTADNGYSLPSYQLLVHPAFTKSQPLPPTAAKDALLRGAKWLQSYSDLLKQDSDPRCVAPYAPTGTTVTCMLEGYGSEIYWNGTQKRAVDVRMDCNAETSMALALLGKVGGSVLNTTTTRQVQGLLDFIYLYSEAQQGPRGDPKNAAYGLIAWGISPGWLDSLYGDDNARVMMASLVASTAVVADEHHNKWAAGILKCALGNLHTSSRYGFRPGAININELQKVGWQHYYNSDFTYHNVSSPQPHYQSFLWAVYARMYNLTGYRGFYDAAMSGITQTVSAYQQSESTWRWTEYISEEFAHMLLPMAWMYRNTPTKQLKDMIITIVDLYLAHQQKDSGCVQEWLGHTGHCSACPPSSNQRFGTGEAPLIQENGNTVTDYLYSNNFAAVGVRELYYATGNTTYRDAADGIINCIIRAQATSTQIPSLNGAWYRAFDYGKWDYWGSSSDWGWGPWSVETGWTQGWIIAGLYQHVTDSSFWDMTNNQAITAELFQTLCPQFLPPDQCS